MSLVESSPHSRGQYSPFTSSLGHESANQQVPGSPLSPFVLTAAPRGGQRSGILCSPSSGSPLAQVPDGGSPLLRRLLAGKPVARIPSIPAVQCRCLVLGQKRRRDEGSPSPSPSSERSRRHSPRVPNSIIILRRTAAPPTTTANKTKGKAFPISLLLHFSFIIQRDLHRRPSCSVFINPNQRREQ